MLPPTRHHSRGFTLIELLVAIGIMAVMAGLSWQGIDGMVRAQTQLQQRADALLTLQAGLGQWSADLDALADGQPDQTLDWDATAGEVATAIDAVGRGAQLHRSTRVLDVTVGADHTTLTTTSGDVRGRWIINAAGLGADHLDAAFGYRRFTVTPRRGELLVFDKLTRPLVPCIVLAVPSSVGKGVLISPTIYGNVMVGPTSEDLIDRSATGTSEAGFEFLLAKGRALMPTLFDDEITASYAGLRAAIDRSDYLIEVDADQRYVLVGGIRSTGLTAGMAIGEHVAGLLADSGLDTRGRPDLPPPPLMPNLGEIGVRPYQDSSRIAADPEYGRIVCFCERVTAGEIRDTFQTPIPPVDFDGLRRRTRVLNGRCQGFYCGAAIQCALESHT